MMRVILGITFFLLQVISSFEGFTLQRIMIRLYVACCLCLVAVEQTSSVYELMFKTIVRHV